MRQFNPGIHGQERLSEDRTYVEENESTIKDNNKINTFNVLNYIIVIEKLTAS